MANFLRFNFTTNTWENSISGPAGPFIQVYPAADILAAEANLFIDGDHSSWQENWQFVAIANGTYFNDLWKYEKSGAMVHTVSRDMDVPTVLQSGHKSNYSILVDCTTVDASIAAGDYCFVEYPIEGFDFLQIAQRSFTVGNLFKATKAGVYCVAFINSAQDRTYVAEVTLAADTWEYKIITVPASPSAGTWDYTNGIGLRVRICLAAGTTFHTAANVWGTSNFATANQVNACDNVANNFRIAQSMLVPGGNAIPYVGRSIQRELAMLNRYYTLGKMDFRIQSTGGYYGPSYKYPTMRVTPTASYTAAAADNLNVTGTPSLTPLNADVNLRTTIQSAGAGDLYYAREFALDARL